jgi:tRNA-dihydrouridine synthase A
VTEAIATIRDVDPAPSRLISVAPMMAWTDRHERVFLRLISRRVRLYTEMVATGAIIHGDRERHLGHDPSEHPLALQLGGADPMELAECVRIAADYGFDEINLNVGCPSDRVRSGRFGACLMLDPPHVARCVGAMSAASQLPVTVKSRIGVDDHDSYAELQNFVAMIADTGCQTLIVHARKAFLSGLSPKENREIPPLKYEYVHRLKQDFPFLEIIINGGIRSLDQAAEQLAHVDGVMFGREAYQNPYMLADVDRRFFGDQLAKPTRQEIIDRFLPYVRSQLTNGVPLAHITRHILGLFNGCPGARAWRRFLSNYARKPGAGTRVIEQAVACIHDPVSLPVAELAG